MTSVWQISDEYLCNH